MSSLDSIDRPDQPQYRKPRADLYTMMLIIAWIALVVACVCLYNQGTAYEWKFKGGPTVTTLPPSPIEAEPEPPPAPDAEAAVDAKPAEQ